MPRSIGLVDRRRLAALVAVLLLAGAMAVAGSRAPAQAATCNGSSRSASSPVARTTFTWALCSDRSVQVWSGTLYDTSCDNRSAHVNFFTQWKTSGPNTWITNGGSSTYKADTGCGNWATYPRVVIPRDAYPGHDCTLGTNSTCQHRMRVHLWACNSTTCSSNYYTDIYYNY
jgi:hypothetical protein